MHEAKTIKEVVHALCMQLCVLEQVDHLDEVEQMQDDGVCLLCQEMALQFAHYCVDRDQDSEAQAHVLETLQWIIDIVVEYEIPHRLGIVVGGAIVRSIDRSQEHAVLQVGALRNGHRVGNISGGCQSLHIGLSGHYFGG